MDTCAIASSAGWPLPAPRRQDSCDLPAAQIEHVGERRELLLQPIEGLQRDDEIAIGTAEAHHGKVDDPRGGLFELAERVAHRRRHDREKRADFIERQRLGLGAVRLNAHDSFPITCSIFCRRMSAVNGLIR